MIIVHHNDADGLCAAALVRMYHESNGHIDKQYPEITFVERCHLPATDFINPQMGEVVYIVDYSLSPAEMEHILNVTNNVVWIDHHISAIEKFKDWPTPITGLRCNGISGCMLTWIWLYKYTEYATDSVNEELLHNLKMLAPYYVRLINDWDVWDHKMESTRAFITGFNAELQEFKPDSDLWWSLDRRSDMVKQFIDRGYIMESFKNGWANSLRNQIGFYAEIEGYKFYCLNCGNINSTYFGSQEELGVDGFMAFSFNGSVWKISMYSTTIDVGDICTRQGGGGHKGAAGYVSDLFPFSREASLVAKICTDTNAE